MKSVLLIKVGVTVAGVACAYLLLDRFTTSPSNAPIPVSAPGVTYQPFTPKMLPPSIDETEARILRNLKLTVQQMRQIEDLEREVKEANEMMHALWKREGNSRRVNA